MPALSSTSSQSSPVASRSRSQSVDQSFDDVSLNSPAQPEHSYQEGACSEEGTGSSPKEKADTAQSLRTPETPQAHRLPNSSSTPTLSITRSPPPEPLSPSPSPYKANIDRILARLPSRSPSYRSFDLEGKRFDPETGMSPTKVALPQSASSPSLGGASSPLKSAPPYVKYFGDRETPSPSREGPHLPRTALQAYGSGQNGVVPEETEPPSSGDTDAPFESIPLHTTPSPPLSAPHVHLPSSPTRAGRLVSPTNKVEKRKSWGGFGMLKDGERVVSGEFPEHPPPPPRAESQPVAGTAAEHGNAGEEISTSASTPVPGTATTARRAAPPPHPFPWPIPTSPPTNVNRLSTISNNSNGTHTTHISRTSTSSQRGSHSHPTPHALGSKGTSTFEKVISHTRPSWLPPKDRTEDVTHLHQWEELMRQSREHERQAARVSEVKKLEKEKRLASELPIWENLLGEAFNVKKVKEDETLRRMWFEGVPSHLRGKAWSMAVGNPLALSRDIYKSYLARARKGLTNDRFPPDLLQTIEHDLDNTLVPLKVFQQGSPMRDELREMICAWLVFRADEGLGYAPYINLLCAMLLLASPPHQAFHTLINLLSRPLLSAFFTPSQPEISAFYRVLENLQADRYPKIYANCKALGVGVPESWFRSLLVEQVGWEGGVRLWDQIMLDGDGFVFRAALAIFGFLEPRLYFPDKDEVLSVLEGHNPASLAILKREKGRARLRGEAFVEGVDGTLSSFGMNEGALFESLDGDGWKDGGFERLVVREMPDE